jgi:hypothetical protein
MTDIGVKYDRFFVTSVMGFGVRRSSFVVRRASLPQVCHVLPISVWELSSGAGEDERGPNVAKLL